MSGVGVEKNSKFSRCSWEVVVVKRRRPLLELVEERSGKVYSFVEMILFSHGTELQLEFCAILLGNSCGETVNSLCYFCGEDSYERYQWVCS